MTEQTSVLIAEDVKPVRLKLEHIVAALGFGSLSASDGEAALVTFSREHPPIVLLDIAMFGGPLKKSARGQAKGATPAPPGR